MDSVELCAGAGGQALGLEAAGFNHLALVENDAVCQATLRLNRPYWHVPDGLDCDVATFDATPFRGIDLLSGGLPCPPFSVAGKQLGKDDERNLFSHALRIIEESSPKAVMIENVRGFLDAVFIDYRHFLRNELHKLGYQTDWRLFNASDFGVPQLRPRVVIVALRSEYRDISIGPTRHCSVRQTLARHCATLWVRTAGDTQTLGLLRRTKSPPRLSVVQKSMAALIWDRHAPALLGQRWGWMAGELLTQRRPLILLECPG